MTPCPCGSADYDQCCGALHRGAREAATPEELMRSRYSAFVKHDEFYLARSWHPRTRPADLSTDPALVWTGLEIVSSEGDTVDFVARYVDADGPGELREHSRFAKRAGRWVYVDGDVS